MRAIIDGNNRDRGDAPLGEIGAILLRRKWQILVTFLVIAGGVAAVTFALPKRYETRMKILVKNERANMVVSAASNPQSSYPGEVSETEINTEIELLNNNDLLQQVVLACQLERLESDEATLSGDRRQIAVERAIIGLEHDLSITAVRKANVIEVDYTARNPRRAVDVLRQLARLYLEAHLRVHSTPGTHEFFLSQTARYQKELKDAETRLARFRRKNDIVLFAQQQEEVLRRASESRSMLLAAEAGIGEYTRKIGDARNQLATAEPRVITQTHVVSNQYSVEHLSTMLVELQNRRTQLLTKYRPDDRMVQEVSQELSDTQAALEKSKALTGSDQATDVNPVRQALELDVAREQAELAGVQQRRRTLLQQSTGYRRQLTRLGNATVEYDDLIRQQKEAEDNYLLYARKTEEARIADSLDQQKIANVAIAENPVEPLLPSKPDIPLNLSLGTLLAGFVSLGFAFGMEYLQQPAPRVETGLGFSIGPAGHFLLETVRQAADLEALTGLPVLAVTKRASDASKEST